MLRSKMLRRPLSAIAAALMVLASIAPLLIQQAASAYGTITARAIKLSSSAVSATSVIYNVSFTAGTTGTIKSMVVEFCANTPIVGDSCTGTVGTTTPANLASATFTPNSGVTGSYTVATLNSNRTLTLTKAAGNALTGGSTVVDFDVGVVTNPSTNASFYARIYTYPNDTGSNSAANYTAATVGTGSDLPTDAGGIALSTAAQITITAKVQERLTFCVYTTGAGNDCSGKSGTSVSLGDTNGVLDPNGPYVDKNAKFTITTNASGNAIVRMKGDTLKTAGGTYNITETGGTPAASSAGTEQFGMCTYQTAGSGLTVDSVYDGGTNCGSTSQTAGTGSTGGAGTATFGFDTGGGSGTMSTYGDTVATKPAGNYSTSTLVFIGNISNSTEAGIYTTTLTFIATGTY